MRFIEAVLEDAIISQLGLTEAGAETPYDEASVLLLAYLEPDLFEATSGFFTTEGFSVVTEMVIDHSLQGQMDKLTLSSGRD